MIQKLCKFAGAQSVAVKGGLESKVVVMNDAGVRRDSDWLALRELA